MKAEQLIVALDGELRDCIGLIQETKDLGTKYKIGLELFAQGECSLIRSLIDDRRIFLDLKIDDIPTTVRRAVRRLGTPRFLSVQGDEHTIKAAIEGKHSVPGTDIIYVPTLSSRSIEDHEFCNRVETAYEAGADGVVASGQTRVTNAKAINPNKIIISPGIRVGGDTHDHMHTLTPTQAFQYGVDYIVVGRPISRSKNARTAIQKLLDRSTRG